MMLCSCPSRRTYDYTSATGTVALVSLACSSQDLPHVRNGSRDPATSAFRASLNVWRWRVQAVTLMPSTARRRAMAKSVKALITGRMYRTDG